MRPHRALSFAGALVVVMVSVATSCGTNEGASAPTSMTVAAHDHAEGTGSMAEMAHEHGSPPHEATTTAVVAGGENWAAPDRSFSVEISEGTVAGGIPRFEASMGDLILITVISDISDEAHLHVSGLTVVVGPGEPAVFNIEATIPGVFEAELHDADFRVFELEVS